MTTTELTAWGHSCVRLERDGRRLVIDPGILSVPDALTGAAGVLITHEHSDHVHAPQLRQALDVDPALEVWGPPAVVIELSDGTVGDNRLHGVTAGDRFDAVGFDVEVLGEWHALAYPSIPRVVNVAYLIDGSLLHPGDSFTVPAGRPVKSVLAPVSGPWLKIAETVDFIHAIAPRLVLPIHDATLSLPGKALVDRLMRQLCPDVEYVRLPTADVLPLSMA
ncbi:MBL fold metallo-hydrolase [Cellulomonas cellasea]|uniref:MBL fold metallo-hydrolase n=1 Tax=Cellulomonas cellasea TaxID=43670 RepID=UPI0025A44333|nr:MBL fold metallo-hydrolase [Cellulomonas cellasea]MDM8085350.1 MBL fold metallo-hydrolase [Cellulomonas cellasea]